MHCKICHTESPHFGHALVLDKYQVDYFRCPKCGFIQTEEPHWITEAYSEALVAFDVGVMQRNLQFAASTSAIILMIFPSAKKFLDYGGGHGTFVRLMRDRGFNFFWKDLYAKNIHARTFEHAPDTRYDLVTVFEVLEHMPNPLEDLAEAFALSDNVLTTTSLVPEPVPTPPNWWYYACRGGQHISFYTPAALQELARHFDRHVLSLGGFHLFTREPVRWIRLRLALGGYTSHVINRLLRRQSLMPVDYEAISGTPFE